MKYAKGSFIVVPNKEAIHGLSCGEQALFMWLCSYADEKGLCFPSRSKLGKDICASPRTVDKHMKSLCEKGLIQKTKRFSDKRRTTNLYQILLVSSQARAKNGTRVDTNFAQETEKNVAERTVSKEDNTKNTTNLNEDPLVSQLIEAFKGTNPSYYRFYTQKAQKDAAVRLIQTHGLRYLLSIVSILPKSNQIKYAPTVTTIDQLEMKLASLEAWASRRKAEAKEEAERVF